MRKTLLVSICIITSIISFAQKADTTRKTTNLTSSPLLSTYEAPSEMLKLLAPNVASMERQGNLPINYSTGQLNYGISLHQINVDNNLKIPIELRYNNSGLKPDQVPTWVGTGWDLFVGGTIVQYVNGINDFASNGLSNSMIRQDLQTYFSGSMTNPTKYYYAKDIDNGNKDSQFDIFSFNFLGRNGKFYFDNGIVYFFNYIPLKITYAANQFTITDELGYQFSFAYSQVSSGSFSDGFIYTNADPFTVSSRTWYLTKITSPSGVETNFTYTGDIDYQINADGKSYAIGANDGQYGCEQSNSFTYQGESYSTTVSQALLSEITWKGKRIAFETVPRNDLMDASGNKAKALSKIIVYNENNQAVRKVGFEYGYFNSNDRLKLNNVSILDNSNTNKIDTHDFEYYEILGQAIPIPSMKLTVGKNPENHSIDHWGYFNGKPNSSKIPIRDYTSVLPTTSTSFGDADRSSDNIYSKIGMLKKIIYPTKGYTEIEYEANKVSYNSYNDVPFFLKNQGAVSYANFFTSSIANCNNTTITGQITLSQAITGAKISWVLETSSLDDNSTFTLKPTGSSTYIVNDFSQPYKQGLLYTDLAVGTYDYTLYAGCVSMNGTPTAQASFVIDKPITPSGSVEIQVGGNRVSRIVDYSSPSGTNDRYITYEQASLLAEPFYISSIEVGHDLGSGLHPCISCGTKYFLGEHNVYNWDGFHIEYRRVTELQGLNGINGKKIFNYDGNYFVGGPMQSSPFPSTFNLGWRSGNLINQETYDKNTTFNLVQKTIQSYTPQTYFPISKNGLKVGKKLTCPIGSTPQAIDNINYNYALMPLFTDKYGIQSTSNIEYFNGSSLTNNIAYTYNDDWLLSKTTTNNSKNQTEEVITYYANDFNNIANTNIDQLKNKHIIGMPLKLVKTLNGNIIEGVLLKSDNVGNPIEVYTYQQSSLMPLSHDPNIYFDNNFALYDSRKYSSKGNLIESITRRKPPTTYVWSYKHAYPIATVINATKTEVENVIGNLETVGDLYNDNDILGIGMTLRTNLPNAQVTSGLLTSGIGLKQLNAPNGLKNTYQYDAINRLLAIKDNQDNITDKFAYQYANSSPSGCATPNPPTISVGSTSLCSISLNASGCGSGIVTWSNGASGNSITVNTNTTSSYNSTCTVAGCSSSNSNSISIPTLPTNWIASNIGNPPTASCVQYDGSTWTLQGTGNTYDASDNFNFVYQSNSGNAVIVAKLNSISNSQQGIRSGLMIRTNSSPTAPYYQFFYDSGFGVLSLYVQDGSTGDGQIGYQVAGLPKWLRLKKNGNDISAWYSDATSPVWNNDADWTLYTTVNSTAFNSGFLMGLLAYNNGYSSNSIVNQTQFSNVSINNF